jgi:AraC family transcriptional regulator, activator of mtrCDE
VKHLQALASPADSKVDGGESVDSSSAINQLPATKPSRIVRFGNVVAFPANPVIELEIPDSIVSGRIHFSKSTVDALLGAVSVEIEAFAICEIGDGVRLIIPPVELIEVHYVLEGTLHLTIDENETLKAGPGAMLIVPPERLQHLATSSDAVMNKDCYDVCVPVREGMLAVDATGGKEPTLRIACVAVMPNQIGSFGPLKSLTRPVVEDLSEFPVVSAAFATLLKDIATPKEGTRAIRSALMKACLVVLLRQHLETSRIAGTAPAVLQDARLSRAIAAILNRPAAEHCLTSLAKEAGMSRSAFAHEFKTAVNMTPMEFVARVRLDLAHRLLETTGMAVEGIATTVGYKSRSHFSHLFREHYGTNPSSFRQCNPCLSANMILPNRHWRLALHPREKAPANDLATGA